MDSFENEFELICFCFIPFFFCSNIDVLHNHSFKLFFIFVTFKKKMITNVSLLFFFVLFSTAFQFLQNENINIQVSAYVIL